MGGNNRMGRARPQYMEHMEDSHYRMKEEPKNREDRRTN